MILRDAMGALRFDLADSLVAGTLGPAPSTAVPCGAACQVEAAGGAATDAADQNDDEVAHVNHEDEYTQGRGAHDDAAGSEEDANDEGVDDAAGNSEDGIVNDEDEDDEEDDDADDDNVRSQ